MAVDTAPKYSSEELDWYKACYDRLYMLIGSISTDSSASDRLNKFKQELSSIIATGFPIDFSDSDGWTLLHWVTEYDDRIMEGYVQVLVDAGANANVVDNEGRTPLGKICERYVYNGSLKYLNAIDSLIVAGADYKIDEQWKQDRVWYTFCELEHIKWLDDYIIFKTNALIAKKLDTNEPISENNMSQPYNTLTDMAVDPIEVGKYIISECCRRKEPISNYKANLLLYFVWIEYYRHKLAILFSNEFSAMKIGPIFIPFYYIHAVYGGIPINKTYTTNISLDVELSINRMLDKYLKLSVGQLYKMACYSNSPWDIVYSDGQGERDPIPYKLIVDNINSDSMDFISRHIATNVSRSAVENRSADQPFSSIKNDTITSEKYTKTRNYDLVRNMSIDELATLLDAKACKCCAYYYGPGPCSFKKCKDGIKLWLEQEVESNVN